MFKISNVSPGQVTYQIKNNKRQSIYYCFIEDFKEIVMCRCSQDLEPSHGISLAKNIQIELPTGDSGIEKKVRNYINAHPMMNGV